MSNLSTQPYKGTRDFYPEDMRVRKWMFDKWRIVSERFGYEEYDGPILEPFELYASKTSDEIVNDQTYSFTDRGDRKVVMRPEMTPTVSRMVAARRQELAYPLRLYSIPNCFRYERPQKGRLREFWQYNADIFGVVGTEADIEIILLADAIIKGFGAKPESYEIQISSRKIISDIVKELNLDDSQQRAIVNLIDKKEKIDEKDWEQLFYDQLDKAVADRLLEFLKEETVPENAAKTIAGLQKRGVTNAVFNRYLARGFDYYTDVVFEVFDKNPDNNRSMFGGGRYDGLVGEFGVDPVPTVGFGMGDVTFLNFLTSNQLVPDLKSETRAYVVINNDESDLSQANELIAKLREAEVNVAADYSQRKTDKQLASAYKKGITYAVIVENGKYTLRNLETKENQDLTDQEIIQTLTI